MESLTETPLELHFMLCPTCSNAGLHWTKHRLDTSRLCTEGEKLFMAWLDEITRSVWKVNHDSR